jgi:molybdopterin-guanine dinucleotide biosynthesis protein MobB
MAAVISFVGRSNSGKTTVIENVITELKSRGYRIATAKNVYHRVVFDEPGKDSWRHIQAGSEATAVSSSEKVILIKPVKDVVKLADIVRLLGEDYDIIIAEGFKQSKVPKIEVHRKEVSTPLVNLQNLIAIVTNEPLKTEARLFSFNDIKKIADFIEKEIIKPAQDKLSIYVNNNRVPVTGLPKDIKDHIDVLVRDIKKSENIDRIEIIYKTK